MTNEPVLLIEPPTTLSPASLVTGMDSPVTLMAIRADSGRRSPS